MINSPTHIYATDAPDALVAVLDNIHYRGNVMSVKGKHTRELLSTTIAIENPLKRCYVLQHRDDNIFSKIAETLWVLAGRNDMDFLVRYLPQARNWSDNGSTWNAAYGARLMNWCGADRCVNQLDECLNVLKQDRASRQAVMVIFDPSEDYQPSKDIPCNNWIHWIIREETLFMNIAQRSSDAIWGFSGINTFEWSVMHEIMANWLEARIGRLTYFITSLHVYEQHWSKAANIRKSFYDNERHTLYSGMPPSFFGIKFSTSHDDFRSLLDSMFVLESAMRHDFQDGLLDRCFGIKDALFRMFAFMLYAYNLKLNGHDKDSIVNVINIMPSCDLKIAAIEYFSRDDDEFMLKLDLSQHELSVLRMAGVI